MLHEDAKPPNVLMTTEGRPMLSDMGVSAMGESVEAVGGGHTVKAALRGATYAFASAKMVRLLEASRRGNQSRELLTHSDDIFCFAGTVFEMFAGSKEWRADKKRAADLWAAQGRELLTTTELRVALPNGMEEVLATCFACC